MLKDTYRNIPRRIASHLSQLGSSLKDVPGNMASDLEEADKAFKLSSDNLGVLRTFPHPAQIIAPMDDQVNGLVHDLTGKRPDRLYSFPSVRNYTFPNYGLQLVEARRVFTNLQHTGFYDQVVGLHILSSNATREHFYGVTIFQPSHEPLSQLEAAQIDGRMNPRHIMDFYGIKPFPFDALPEALNHDVVDALQRIRLL